MSTPGPSPTQILAEAMRELLDSGMAWLTDSRIAFGVQDGTGINLDADSLATLKAALDDTGDVRDHDPDPGSLGAFDAQFRRLCERHHAQAAVVVACPDQTLRFVGPTNLVRLLAQALADLEPARDEPRARLWVPPVP